MSIPVDFSIRQVLQRLHAEAAEDARRWAAREASSGAASGPSGGGDLVRLGEFYLAVSPDEGEWLYLMARLARARYVVEFGTSFGVSTLYLAAAARANGGRVATTEVHPEKCAVLRQTFAEAEVSDVVTLLEGDARETLARLSMPVDLLFLDGWKSQYLPVFELLKDRLVPGALVLADNCDHEAAADYVAAMTDPAADCLTLRQGDMLVSYWRP